MKATRLTPKPIARPKGWRVIDIDGIKWFWTPSDRNWIVARNAATGAKVEANCRVVDQLQKDFGPGKWDEFHECSMIEPRHVAGWLKDLARWEPAAKLKT